MDRDTLWICPEPEKKDLPPNVWVISPHMNVCGARFKEIVFEDIDFSEPGMQSRADRFLVRLRPGGAVKYSTSDDGYTVE